MSNQKKVNKLGVDFVLLPRFIAADVREGKLKRTEYYLYVWLRNQANPYGIIITSVKQIKDDLFPTLRENSVYQLLRSLRSKKYVYYKTRQGHRGSFDVHFGFWLLPDESVKHLDYLFKQEGIRSQSVAITRFAPEVSQNYPSGDQKSDSASKPADISRGGIKHISEIRTAYKETEKEKENESSELKKYSEIPTSTYQPRTHGETICRDIAVACREPTMNWILSLLNTYGDSAIQRAWVLCQEELTMTDFPIENLGKYVTAKIKKIAT